MHLLLPGHQGVGQRPLVRPQNLTLFPATPEQKRGKGVGVWGRELGPLVPPPEVNRQKTVHRRQASANSPTNCSEDPNFWADRLAELDHNAWADDVRQLSARSPFIWHWGLHNLPILSFLTSDECDRRIREAFGPEFVEHKIEWQGE